MEAFFTMSKINQYKISWAEIYMRVNRLPKGYYYGIPRGGQIIAGLTGRAVDSVQDADYYIDDIIDSGKTMSKLTDKPFYALFDKRKEFKNIWLVLPWENTQQDIEDTVIRQLEYIGEDVKREGLIDTPKRVIKSWSKLYGGYKQNPKNILCRTFTEKHDQMIILKHIELYSTCEHHLLPFTGECSIGYIPNGKVVGISKLARLIECFSRRIQIQERLTEQIVEAIDTYLKPKGVICIINAQHFCMTSRGVEKQHSIMTTSALRGVFEKEVNSRQEFLNLIRG